MDGRSAGLAPFDPRALAQCHRCLSLPSAAHGLCEDYRAAAGVDLEHDRADLEAGRSLTMPVLVLWGSDGVGTGALHHSMNGEGSRSTSAANRYRAGTTLPKKPRKPFSRRFSRS